MTELTAGKLFWYWDQYYFPFDEMSLYEQVVIVVYTIFVAPFALAALPYKSWRKFRNKYIKYYVFRIWRRIATENANKAAEVVWWIWFTVLKILLQDTS